MYVIESFLCIVNHEFPLRWISYNHIIQMCTLETMKALILGSVLSNKTKSNVFTMNSIFLLPQSEMEYFPE